MESPGYYIYGSTPEITNKLVEFTQQPQSLKIFASLRAMLKNLCPERLVFYTHYKKENKKAYIAKQFEFIWETSRLYYKKVICKDYKVIDETDIWGIYQLNDTSYIDINME